MTVEILLVLLVGATFVAIAAQCFSVWRTSQSIQQLSQKVAQQSGELESRLRVVQGRLLEVTEDLKPLRTMAENLARSLDEISATIRSRADDVDRFVDEVLTLGRDQASKVDYLVTDTVQKFEQTTEMIQKDILRPAVEVSSFVKGIKAGLEVLFARKPSAPADQASEEELFI